mmetsp:Transcript_1820/g.5804  ORF Transcript_1820/g.5804 Transcript_1820/m.5804 type:complete len:209 (-) Transcript_1820:42-668(-)
MSRGAFIVLEGIDRSGKTSQLATLLKALGARGVPVAQERFPDRSTAVGSLLNRYLTSDLQLEDHAVHLLFSANRWEVSQRLEETLASGTHVLCDRYTASGAAFTYAKGIAPLDWCVAPDVGLVAPDAVIFLDIEVEEAARRGNYGEERYESRDFQTKVKEAYEHIMRDKPYWHRIPAARDPESVATDVLRVVEEVIAVKKEGPPARIE